MSDTGGAVFLSYASQDAEAARRISDALRAAGIEVWFDQSELRGGDAWDQKIRKQIKECALFVPIISANTQARQEGYFRLEWRLADQRTHLMSHDRGFIVPVVVDDTKDQGARVPDSFVAVQWTQLPAGALDSRFVERVREMLSLPTREGPSSVSAVPHVSPPLPTASRGLGARTGRRNVRWFVSAVALAVVAFIAFRPAAPKPLNPRLKTQNSELPSAGVADKSIAVLPFTNLSDDKESTLFFSDGMHEDILTNLANIRDLRVVSRTSVMEYRNTTKKIPQIARELGVAYILEGSVRRAGNQVRITGQLIRAANDEHLWARSYDRELTPKEVFAIQAALSTEIAGALQAAISPETKKLLERRPTENLAAYDLYLKGRARMDPRPTRIGDREREKFFRAAVELDPKFAEAWGELAAVHADFVLQDFDHTPERLARADAAIGRAVLLAPESPEVIRLVGNYAYFGYRDYARATEQYEKVIRLQPNNSEAIYRLGAVQRRQGRWPESIANMRKAIELDPGNPNLAAQLALSYISLRRWDEAFALQRKVIALVPANTAQRQVLANMVFVATGSTKEADDWIAGLSPAQRDSPRVQAALKYWANVKGDYAEWKRLDERQRYFDDDDEPHWQQAVGAALVLAAHGELERARARLENFPSEVRDQLEREPANASLRQGLSLMEALLGQKAEALRDARKAVELVPSTLDVLISGRTIRNLAAVYALVGENDQAISELTGLRRTRGGEGLSAHALRVDAAFAPLRGDPRFEALLNDPKNNEPLF